MKSSSENGRVSLPDAFVQLHGRNILQLDLCDTFKLFLYFGIPNFLSFFIEVFFKLLKNLSFFFNPLYFDLGNKENENEAHNKQYEDGEHGGELWGDDLGLQDAQGRSVRDTVGRLCIR